MYTGVQDNRDDNKQNTIYNDFNLVTLKFDINKLHKLLHAYFNVHSFSFQILPVKFYGPKNRGVSVKCHFNGPAALIS